MVPFVLLMVTVCFFFLEINVNYIVCSKMFVLFVCGECGRYNLEEDLSLRYFSVSTDNGESI